MPKSTINNKKGISGFTLFELILAMAIMALLATFVILIISSAQRKSRDAKRKAELKALVNALETYYQDYNKYPNASANGRVMGCPSTVPTVCPWGTGVFRDANNTYLSKVPVDPTSSQSYYYRIVDASNQKFQLYAHLENPGDIDCIEESGVPNCQSPAVPANVTCGTNGGCNFSLTSTNTNPTE